MSKLMRVLILSCKTVLFKSLNYGVYEAAFYWYPSCADYAFSEWCRPNAGV
jgi:hypothetical protein